MKILKLKDASPLALAYLVPLLRLLPSRSRSTLCHVCLLRGVPNYIRKPHDVGKNLNKRKYATNLDLDGTGVTCSFAAFGGSCAPGTVLHFCIVHHLHPFLFFDELCTTPQFLNPAMYTNFFTHWRF